MFQSIYGYSIEHADEKILWHIHYGIEDNYVDHALRSEVYTELRRRKLLTDNTIKYYYVVNTFYNGEPVRRVGCIDASSESDAIYRLISLDEVDTRGYEFLVLKRI